MCWCFRTGNGRRGGEGDRPGTAESAWVMQGVTRVFSLGHQRKRERNEFRDPVGVSFHTIIYSGSLWACEVYYGASYVAPALADFFHEGFDFGGVDGVVPIAAFFEGGADDEAVGDGEEVFDVGGVHAGAEDDGEPGMGFGFADVGG
ncbi:MAG: hypothetical protein JWR19_1242, partial [Pedosphaera sp.]|nr:hypothetical protein [Pedosphaera sp.]